MNRYIAFIAVIVLFTAFSAHASGPVSHWKLDGNANDSVGSNDGTIHGATTTTGRIDSALSFDGMSDYVDIPSNASLEPQYITVSFWAYPVAGRYFITNYESASDGAFLIQLDTSGNLQSAVCISDTLQAGSSICLTRRG